MISVWLATLLVMANGAEVPTGHLVRVRMAGSNDVTYRCVENKPGETWPADQLCTPGPITHAELIGTSLDHPVPGPKKEVFPVLPRIQPADAFEEIPRPVGPPPMPMPASTRPLSTPFGASYQGPMDFGALRTLAEADGLSPVIFDRAAANFRAQRNQGKSSRGCFAATDGTSSPGRTWLLCFHPTRSVRRIETAIGGGYGTGCESQFKNRDECPKFWGNKPESCLTPGGNFRTGESRGNSSTRVFTPLIGLDGEVNGNSLERGIGINAAVDHSGNATAGKIDPRGTSGGSLIWPAGIGGEFAMNELGTGVPGGALAVYVYPAKEDLQKMMRGEEAPYWDRDCRPKIRYAGWIDKADTDATLFKTFETWQNSEMQFMLTEPDARDWRKTTD